jgi:hypothetical protein
MTDEEFKKYQSMSDNLNRALEKAEARALGWKWACIVIFCIMLFAILDLRGCIPATVGQ